MFINPLLPLIIQQFLISIDKYLVSQGIMEGTRGYRDAQGRRVCTEFTGNFKPVNSICHIVWCVF